MVALVQLARAADRQKEPALSDLEGGSDIEADADGVIFSRPHPEKQERYGESRELTHGPWKR